MRSIRFTTGVLAAACLMAGNVMAEKMKNPEYEMWAKFKPGAMSKLQGHSEAMGQKSEQTITTKLIDLTPEKAVVETTMSMMVGGNKMDMPGQKREVLAMVEMAGVPASQPAAAGNAPKTDAKTSTESVTVDGKKLDCKVTEAHNEQEGMKTMAKTWTSEQVPGGLVKLETETSGKLESKTTQELVEFSTGG